MPTPAEKVTQAIVCRSAAGIWITGASDIRYRTMYQKKKTIRTLLISGFFTAGFQRWQMEKSGHGGIGRSVHSSPTNDGPHENARR